MPMISDLTVADLRGARDMIQQHLLTRCGIDTPFKFEMGRNEVSTWLYHGSHGAADHAFICESATYDTDWTEFLDKVWKRVGQIPSREVREIRSVMEALGSAIEILDKSKAEFAVDLTARIKQARDEAGARLIEFQQAAE